MTTLRRLKVRREGGCIQRVHKLSQKFDDLHGWCFICDGAEAQIPCSETMQIAMYRDVSKPKKSSPYPVRTRKRLDVAARTRSRLDLVRFMSGAGLLLWTVLLRLHQRSDARFVSPLACPCVLKQGFHITRQASVAPNRQCLRLKMKDIRSLSRSLLHRLAHTPSL